MSNPAPPTIRKRPWLAALLSLISPGGGQFYTGRVRAGLTVFAVMFVSAALFFGFLFWFCFWLRATRAEGYIGWIESTGAFFFFAGLFLTQWILGAVEAYRSARNATGPTPIVLAMIPAATILYGGAMAAAAAALMLQVIDIAIMYK